MDTRKQASYRAATPTRRPVAHRAASKPHLHPHPRRADGAPEAATANVHGVAKVARPARSDRGLGPKGTKAVAVVAACFVVVLAVGWCYFTMWRSFPVTVNGEEYQVKIGTDVQSLLEDNEYFGVTPGRLLSVSGNVLDEKGGDRAAVTMDEQPVAAADFATTEVVEGSSFSVANGADATESHTEEAVSVAPGLQMGAGGAIQYVSQWGKAGEKTVWHGKRSGETVDHEVTKEPEDMIIASVNPNPQGKKKYMALTFDDGPSEYTQAILDILSEKDAKATFYNLGSQAAAYPDLCKAVVDGGHELASHTNQHQNLPTLDRDSLRGEISSAFDSLEGASGTRPQMMRAPYGAFTGTEWARSGDIISCNALWNIDTLDWKLPGAGAIKDQVLSNASNGAIALMHDGGGNREQDVAALPGIIDGLHDAGYELVTVSELMRLDGTFPKDVVNGTVKMPKDTALPQM